MYLLTLPSPPCNCVDKPWLVLFCFFVKNACIKKPCPSNAICQAGFSSEGYRCVCVPGYTGEDCTKGEADIRVQYLSISSHLTIMKVGDGDFSTLLVHFFLFFCRGWRKSSGELWEKTREGSIGGSKSGGGGLVTIGRKGVYPFILIAASRDGERDEPSLQCNPASSSKRLPFLTVRLLSLSSK